MSPGEAPRRVRVCGRGWPVTGFRARDQVADFARHKLCEAFGQVSCNDQAKRLYSDTMTSSEKGTDVIDLGFNSYLHPGGLAGHCKSVGGR